MNPFAVEPNWPSCQEQITYECETREYPEGGEGCDLCFIGDFHGNDCLGLKITTVSLDVCPPGNYEVQIKGSLGGKSARKRVQIVFSSFVIDTCLFAEIATRPEQVEDKTVFLDGEPLSWELFPKYKVVPSDCQYTLESSAPGLENYL